MGVGRNYPLAHWYCRRLKSSFPCSSPLFLGNIATSKWAQPPSEPEASPLPARGTSIATPQRGHQDQEVRHAPSEDPFCKKSRLAPSLHDLNLFHLAPACGMHYKRHQTTTANDHATTSFGHIDTHDSMTQKDQPTGPAGAQWRKKPTTRAACGVCTSKSIGVSLPRSYAQKKSYAALIKSGLPRDVG